MTWRGGAVLWLILTLSPGLALAIGERGGLRPERSAASVPVGPAHFDPDPSSRTYSANITHPYFPLALGEQLALSGYGSSSGDLHLITAWDSIFTVDGVDCLYVIEEYFAGAVYARFDYALAQDVAGNVWTLLDVAWAGEVFEPFFYGSAASEYFFFWRDMEVADSPWIVSVDEYLEQQRTGVGPYSDCLQTTNADFETYYYAPDVGLVKIVFGDGGGLVRVPLDQPQEGFGALQFDSEVYDAIEEGGTFPVTVVRSGGSQEVVWVEFEVSGVTSSFIDEGDEVSVFSSDPKTVFLAPGQTEVIFDVVVLDNTIWNNRRTGTLTLSSPGGGAELGARATATVHIEEDESGTDGGNFIGPCFLDTLTSW